MVGRHEGDGVEYKLTRPTRALDARGQAPDFIFTIG